MSLPPIHWQISAAPVTYPEAVTVMEDIVARIRGQEAPETIWLLQHPPLYTAGTSAAEQDFLGTFPFPVYKTGRGGQYTYHGLGQRIAYVMLDLRSREIDIRQYICKLEQWLINTLQHFGVHGERRTGRVGIWVCLPDGTEEKIAAVGVRVRRGVSYHGIALNVAPNLEHFKGIIPCGLKEYGVTSLEKLGIHASLSEVDSVLQKFFYQSFEIES